MPNNANKTIKLQLKVGVRFLVLYRNLCKDMGNHGLRYNGWKLQSGWVTGDNPQKAPLVSTILSTECFQR